MKAYFRATFVTAIAAVLLTGISMEVVGQTKRPALRTATKRPATQSLFTVPSGTRMRVRMNETLSSKTAKAGDRFTVTVREPVYASNGAIVVPIGSEVIGRVNSVKPAVKGGKVGEIDVSFIQLVLPNGTKRTINGSLTELVSDDAKSDAEGTAKGDKTKYRKVIFIGGGGAGGAILGGAIGGGKGALIGGIIGAGAGLLGERLTKGEEAEVRSGTHCLSLQKQNRRPRFPPVRGGRTSYSPETLSAASVGSSTGRRRVTWIFTTLIGTPSQALTP